MAGTTVVRSNRGSEMQDSTTLETRLQHNKLVDDVEVLRAALAAANTQINALVADMATRISNHNTLTTKLNADAGVTDTNYAAAGAITAVVVTTTTVDTAGDLTAAKVANQNASTTT